MVLQKSTFQFCQYFFKSERMDGLSALPEMVSPSTTLRKRLPCTCMCLLSLGGCWMMCVSFPIRISCVSACAYFCLARELETEDADLGTGLGATIDVYICQTWSQSPDGPMGWPRCDRLNFKQLGPPVCSQGPLTCFDNRWLGRKMGSRERYRHRILVVLSSP